MKTAKPLYDLAPGAAWNEALRRSLAICIAGFFLPNLLAEFGAIPQLHQSFHFLPGVCGIARAFLASLALFMGYYHRKLIQSAAFAVCAAILPYLATWFWFRLAHPSDSAGMLQLCGPTAIAAIVGYGFLIWWRSLRSNSAKRPPARLHRRAGHGTRTLRFQRVAGSALSNGFATE